MQLNIYIYIYIYIYNAFIYYKLLHTTILLKNILYIVFVEYLLAFNTSFKDIILFKN